MSEKEIQKLKDKLFEKEVNLDDLKIKDLTIEEMFPQTYNGVIISKLDGYHTLHLPYGMDSGKFKTFQKSGGGVFSNDSLNYTRGKEHGNYVLIEGKGERKIVRLIEDEELTLFQSLRLIKGIIKDKPYMLLRNLTPDEKINNIVRYIEKENSEHEEVEEVMAIPTQVIVEDDDHETNATSVSLFEDN
jgi:hypothetical protein